MENVLICHATVVAVIFLIFFTVVQTELLRVGHSLYMSVLEYIWALLLLFFSLPDSNVYMVPYILVPVKRRYIYKIALEENFPLIH